jgi:ATP-binding cassette subfamily B protein
MSEQTQTSQTTKNAGNGIRVPGMGGPRGGGPMGARLNMEKPQEGKKTFRRLVEYFVEEKKLFLIMLLVVLLLVVCQVMAPKLQSDAIDRITARSTESLPLLLGVMLGLYLLAAAATWAQGFISAHLSQRIVKKMRSDLFRKVVHLPIRYTDTHVHGDIMSRMTNDVENVSNTISQSLASLMSGVLTIIGTVAMMIYLCPKLALLSCITVILTVLVTKALSGRMRVLFRKRQDVLGTLNGTVEEMVTGYRTVVAYNRQEQVEAEFDQSSDELTRVGIIAECLGNTMGPTMNVIQNLGFIIIAVAGGYLAIHQEISIGVISAFIVYAKQFGRPINEIAQLYAQIQTAIAGAERVFAVLDENEEDMGGRTEMSDLKGNVSFSHVDFSYVEGKQVLYDFSLDVKAGHKIALVGATGSGKTTVVNLLMRFYDVDSGSIKIDGTDIRDMDLRELRRNTAIVLQDTVLFSDTIRNNLKYSRLDASKEELAQAAEMSNADGMIRRLKDGYETMLSEGGQNLSQGQRQLLSIGRAFLADPKILILDEATSSVDTRTEKHIQNAMLKLMEHRTSLIIAHRLSTIRDADLIIVMDQGRIAEQGNHEELLEMKGKYYELYMTQFAGKAT